MVDYEKIGRRIYEQRKYIRKVSQEKMAEDLGMYQADISNLEKAKKGSGIGDLYKLDMIADYFEIPLERLVFGIGDDQVVKYYGDRVSLKQTKKKVTKRQLEVLQKIMGLGDEINSVSFMVFAWGPYVLLNAYETQYAFGGQTTQEAFERRRSHRGLKKMHTFIFLGDELAAVMVADCTSVMQHVYQPALAMLQECIPWNVLDVTDAYRTLNPYWMLYQFAETEEEKQQYFTPMVRRMDALRQLGENRSIFYVESVYVRVDYRRHGIFRLYTDLLKTVSPGCIIWLNMEPTSGAELSGEYDYFPSYTPSELGQLNMNAAIAERVGYMVDPDPWRRQGDVLKENGEIVAEILSVRKCAYILPEEIRNLLAQDGDLVAVGRAKQKLVQSRQPKEEEIEVTIQNGMIEEYSVSEWQELHVKGSELGKVVCCYVAKKGEDEYRFGVSRRSVFDYGFDHPGQMESYAYLDDAENSDYWEVLLFMLSQRDMQMPEEMIADLMPKRNIKNIRIKL